MSRIRDNYKNSPAGRFEAWYKDGYDPMDERLDVHKPAEATDERDVADVIAGLDLEDTVYDRTTNKALRMSGYIYKILSVVLCVVMIGTLIWMVQYLPRFGQPDNPVNNEVSERYIGSGVQAQYL